MPEAVEEKGSYCESLDSGAAALQVRIPGQLARLLAQSTSDLALCILSPSKGALSTSYHWVRCHI